MLLGCDADRGADIPTKDSSSTASSGPHHVSQQLPIIGEPARRDKPLGVGIYTPAPGSAERVVLMNALRRAVREEMGGHVVFVVAHLRSNGEWAYGELEPTWPDGRPIEVEATPAYRAQPQIEGLRTLAIWRKEAGLWPAGSGQEGRWRVHAHRVGTRTVSAPDPEWQVHCRTVPPGLIPGC